MMRSASRSASAAIRPDKRAAFASEDSTESLLQLSVELYDTAEILVAQPRLRRLLADSATDAEGRANLLRTVIGSTTRGSTQALGAAIVKQRWSSAWDLTDAFETAGDDALFAASEREGVLDRVADELFRFERILDSNSTLTTLLDEHVVDRDKRVGLLDQVLDGRVHEITRALLVHATRSGRKQTLALAIDDLLEEAAERSEHSLARVISAVELSREQTERLAGSLSRMYGQPISVRTAVAPAVRGGLIVRIGDEVIDGSVAARFIDVRTGLAARASRADITTRTRQGKH